MQGKLFSFYLNNMLMGIDITKVKEINRTTDYNPVPGSPDHILGLLNLRGSIVTVFDLKKIMKLSVTDVLGRLCMIMRIIPGQIDQVAFMIDKPGELVDVEESMCEAMPANYYGLESFPGTEVCKQSVGVIPIIDVNSLFRHLA